ncbi:hypothetical protein ACFWBS_58135 [Streptomyces mirabilis]
MSAALTLGRARRRTLVIDAGQQSTSPPRASEVCSDTIDALPLSSMPQGARN